MSKSDLIDIVVQLKAETDKAWLVNDGTKDVWVPKSQCKLYKDAPLGRNEKILTLPEWLAHEKELI